MTRSIRAPGQTTVNPPYRHPLEGAAAGDRFGHSVRGAGDVNGDGYADVIVGTYPSDPGGRARAGTASVFYGSAGWSQPAAGTARTPDRLFEGSGFRAFGFSVAGAGDVDGDGYSDLAVWAFLALPGGRAYASATNVFYGSATWTQPPAGTASTADRLIQGAGGDTVNTSLASAGDVNGDGYADLIVGAGWPGVDGRLAPGRASVYYGSATWTQPPSGTASTPDRYLEGAPENDGFGTSVAGAGDVNGDGYADLIVGAMGTGRASVFYGSATWAQPPAGTASTPDRLLERTAPGGVFGWSVAGAGDVDGDGYADVVVGAFQADPGGREDAGAASVYHGSATWTQPPAGTASTPDRLLEGAAADDWFGVSVASADDLRDAHQRV